MQKSTLNLDIELERYTGITDDYNIPFYSQVEIIKGRVEKLRKYIRGSTGDSIIEVDLFIVIDESINEKDKLNGRQVSVERLYDLCGRYDHSECTYKGGVT